MASVLEQLACEVPTESAPTATFKAPFRAILGFSAHDSIYFYSWLTIIMLYIVIYFFLPLCSLNSSNGFKSGQVVLISSFVIFAIVVMAYVIWNRNAACESKRGKALFYLQGRKALLPNYLQPAAEHVINETKKNGFPWTPLDPVVKRPKKLPY
jgi:hypothetical protein